MEQYLTLASLVAAGDGERVAVTLVGMAPYGMWWDTIRPALQIVDDTDSVALPDGILDGGGWRPALAADIAETRARMPWLTEDADS